MVIQGSLSDEEAWFYQLIVGLYVYHLEFHI